MIPFASAVSRRFTWSRLPHNRGYELKLNGSVVGTIRRRSLWTSDYDGTTSEKSFRIRRNSWCGTRAEIVDSISQEPIAAFESGWRKPSVLTFTDGLRFQITRKGCWRPQWGVTRENGQPVLSLDVRQKTGNPPVGTEVEDSRLSLLILFILYRIRQAEDDAAVSAVVAAISVAAAS